jgi:hypothetical protein
MHSDLDIFGRLIMDHELHRDLIDALGETQGGSEERAELFERLTKEVKSHAAAEEQALYSTMMRKPETTDETRHSVAEHQEIQELLNDLAATPMSSGAWMTKFRTLRDRYLHHINEGKRRTSPITRAISPRKMSSTCGPSSNAARLRSAPRPSSRPNRWRTPRPDLAAGVAFSVSRAY